MIYQAKPADVQIVANLVHRTIHVCYPAYFSENVVEFFIHHHSEEKIKNDLINANVFLMESDGYLVGTGTIKDNEIKRLFILPQYQRNRFGSELLACLEDEIAVRESTTAQVDAHAYVLQWYKEQGYHVVAEHSIHANGEQLPYYRMEKAVTTMNLDHLYQGLMFSF